MRIAVVRLLIFGALILSSVSAADACDGTIFGEDGGGGLWQFQPPAAAATRVAGNPTLPSGSIARGPYSGNIFVVEGDGSNSRLFIYDLTAKTLTQVGALPNTAFLYASGFSPDGVGYAISNNEVVSYSDSTSPITSFVGVPQTTSGPPISAFNSGDLAVDSTNRGWIILSDTQSLSYLYELTFGNPTLLQPVAQITLNGSPYNTADLYSSAFGADGNLYTSSGNNGTLFALSTATGALTPVGNQGAALFDFGSCPFNPSLSLVKTGPTRSAPGELLAYRITVSNSASARLAGANVMVRDVVPSGVTIVSSTCSASGAVCPMPTVSGQTIVTTVLTLPPGATATLTINGRNTALPLGMTTNTATLTANGGGFGSASTSTLVVANAIVKTVANITASGPVGTSGNGSPGDILEYSLTYTNATNALLSNFTLADALPANTAFVAASAMCTAFPAGLTCTPSGPTAGIVNWSLTGGVLAAGQSVSVKFRVTIL